MICRKYHISLRKLSLHKGYGISYLSERTGSDGSLSWQKKTLKMLLEYSNKHVTKRDRDFAQKTARKSLYSNAPKATIYSEIYWYIRKPLTPLGNILRSRGISIDKWVHMRNLTYSSADASIKATRLSWPMLLSDARALNMKPQDLLKLYHRHYHRHAVSIYTLARLYLQHISNYAFQHKADIVDKSLRIYLQMPMLELNVALPLIYRIATRLHIKIMSYFRCMAKFRALQYGSPTYVFLLNWMNATIQQPKGRFQHKSANRFSMSFMNITEFRYLLTLQSADDSLPQNTVNMLAKHMRTLYRYPRTNHLKNLTSQHIYNCELRTYNALDTPSAWSRHYCAIILGRFKAELGWSCRDIGKAVYMTGTAFRAMFRQPKLNKYQEKRLTKHFPRYRNYFAYCANDLDTTVRGTDVANWLKVKMHEEHIKVSKIQLLQMLKLSNHVSYKLSGVRLFNEPLPLVATRTDSHVFSNDKWLAHLLTKWIPKSDYKALKRTVQITCKNSTGC